MRREELELPKDPDFAYIRTLVDELLKDILDPNSKFNQMVRAEMKNWAEDIYKERDRELGKLDPFKDVPEP